MYQFKDVRYKDILSIDKLTIEEHLVTSIVGPSGSGKTTFIRLLNKLISPDSGEILHKGKPMSELNSVDLRRSVVMLPQQPAIYPGTVKDNLLMGLVLSEKDPVNDEALLEVLEAVKLKKDLKDNAELLSGGEKQRLALGRVLLMEPEVLLLDEPSSALDDKTELMIIEEVVEYTRRNKKTLVMVTHSNRIAEDFSDRTIKISGDEPVQAREVSR
ncbi:ABC transporter ATP-binding protein [Gudongella sp. SC589]|uniref:ABC transporter ATP-binding protein n=1 Tax=Gudongella sp. SC589 TaxID=3385990 RepID=UPI003904A190